MHKSTYLHFLQLVVWSFTWSSLDSSWITSLSLPLASKHENLSELGGVRAFLWAIDWEFVRIGRCSSVSLGDWLRIWKNWETLRHLLGAVRQHFFKASQKMSWDKKPPKTKIIFTCGESFRFTLRISDIIYTRVKYHKKLALCLRWQNR